MAIFLAHANFNRFANFEHEHFDEELITSIKSVFSIPPTVGTHRDWAMDNELTRNPMIPGYAFQWTPHSSNTLQDYIITNLIRRPEVALFYKPVYRDEISGHTLFKRNKFLKRTKIIDHQRSISGNARYTDFFSDKMNHPHYMRTYGFLENMSIWKPAYIVFTTEDLEADTTIFYQAVPLHESYPIAVSGHLEFDFSMILPTKSESQRAKVYFWNRDEELQNGQITLEVYEFADQ